MALRNTPGVEARVVAAKVLDAVLHDGRSLKAELGAALPSIADVRDRALVEATCFAAIRGRARYAAAIDAWVPKPLPRRDAPLRALLLAGFAQLDGLGLPPHAAVAATVEAARVLGRAHQAGMVNALLRRATREPLPDADADAHWPQWLRDRLQADWPDAYAAIVAGSTRAAPTWLRINRLRTTRDDYRARLADAGIVADTDPALADALRIDGTVAVAALPGFDDGDASVQDGAAQAVADALAPAPGARVLDACAAPGGKAAHLLERDPALRLTAIDSDARRLRRIADTFARLRVGADARMLAADATEPAGWHDGAPFDAILIDAPCSATGVIRRQPDVLLHRRAADIDALVALQARLLDALWPLLRPGGTLLYATCSVLRAENGSNVDAFLARTPDAMVDPLPDAFGLADGPGRQRLPGDGGMDGFFLARLRRADTSAT